MGLTGWPGSARMKVARESRGFNGSTPVLRRASPSAGFWATALVLPATAGVVAVTAVLA